MSAKQELHQLTREALINDIKALTLRIKAIDPSVKTSKDEELIEEMDDLNVAMWQFHINP